MPVKRSVSGFDAVVHKGQLRGGKLLAVELPVGIQRKPLAQAQLQDEVIFGTAAAVHHRGGGIIQEGGGVRWVVKAFSAHAGVRRRAKPEVIPAVPVDQVVLSLIAGLCKVGDLVLAVAVVFQLLHRVKIEIGGFVAGGQPLGRVLAEGRVRLDL